MKRSLFILVCVPFFIVSCDDALQKETFQEEASFDFLGMINSLGFDSNSAVDMGDYFLVEGDIKLDKEELPMYGKVATRQAHANYTIAPEFVGDLKIRIAPGLNNSSNWREAILAVMQNYNRLVSNIYMYEESTMPDITISYATLYGAWAQGAFPTADQKAGKTIEVSNTASANNLSLEQKIFLIAHEMGHNLGFRHTDYLTKYSGSAEGVGDVGAHHVPGTPIGTTSSKDKNSVFNSGNYYNGRVIPWQGFSYYDEIALEKIYPKIYTLDDIEFSIINTGFNLEHIKDITLRKYPDGIVTRWELVGNSFSIMRQENNWIKLKTIDVNQGSWLYAYVSHNGQERVLRILLLPISSVVDDPNGAN